MAKGDSVTVNMRTSQFIVAASKSGHSVDLPALNTRGQEFLEISVLNRNGKPVETHSFRKDEIVAIVDGRTSQE